MAQPNWASCRHRYLINNIFFLWPLWCSLHWRGLASPPPLFLTSFLSLAGSNIWQDDDMHEWNAEGEKARGERRKEWIEVVSKNWEKDVCQSLFKPSHTHVDLVQRFSFKDTYVLSSSSYNQGKCRRYLNYVCQSPWFEATSFFAPLKIRIKPFDGKI